MLQKRVKIQSVVENQLPEFVLSESQRSVDFLETYYRSVEFQGAPVNILENIDQYVKVGTYSSIVGFTSITEDVQEFDATIPVGSTSGWPDRYGLLQIEDEIITYTSKTDTAFTGCIRGFSGITTYRSVSNPSELVFEQSEAESHVNGSTVKNLSAILLNEFLRKLKVQFLPGFEDRELATDLNVVNFIRQAKDFYTSKGTKGSFEILFRSIFGEDVEVIKPQDDLFIPSDAGYRRTKQLTVVPVTGDLRDLKTKTIYQDNDKGENISFGSVVDVQEVGNKNFYRINVDYLFDADTNVFGTIFGEFSMDSNTRVIGNVSSGSTVINVDSTVGFGTTGTLSVDFSNGVNGLVEYTSKSNTQFFGCSGISSIILDKTELFNNTSSYGYDDDGNKIEFKVKGSLNEFTQVSNDVPFYEKEDIITLKSLGSIRDNLVEDSLIYNNSFTLDVEKIEAIFNGYSIQTYDAHMFRSGDSITVTDGSGNTFTGTIQKVKSNNIVESNKLTGINLAKGPFIVRRDISFVDSKQSNLNVFQPDVLAAYRDLDDNVYIASNSLPKYGDPIETESGKIELKNTAFSGDTFNINNHGLYTGERVHYTPDITLDITRENGVIVDIARFTTPLGTLDEGEYFVKKVNDNQFKLAASRADIYFEKYQTITGFATDQSIDPSLSFKNRLDATKQLTFIPGSPETISTKVSTKQGLTGILVNGVNIINYKSNDFIYYDNIESFNQLSGGEDYDVINPPKVIIGDPVGSGATATADVIGSLQSIDVLNPGSDFIENPVVEVRGGGGQGAVIRANLKSEIIVNFTDTSESAGYISTSSNTIGFSTYHRLRTGDLIVYNSNDQTPIGIGSTALSEVRDDILRDNASYFARVIDLHNISLHTNSDDSFVGIGTINITSFGVGNHIFKTVETKRVLASLSVENAGSGYRNNRIEVPSSGINTALNTISFNNHGFVDGDIVKYSFEGTSVSGLSTTQKYYILDSDKDSFKLAVAGVGTTATTVNFDRKIVNELYSVGVGTHIFNFPEIEVIIKGISGIETSNVETFAANIKPRFRGYINKLNLISGGQDYGNEEIINFNREPNITFESGSGAQLKPIISKGQISEVLILNPGYDYNSTPSLTLSGLGTGAVLTPIIENGRFVSVTVNQGGAGFTTDTSFVHVTPAGKGASASANIKTWNINDAQRNTERVTNSDTFIHEKLNDFSSGSLGSYYVPRDLRKSINSISPNGNPIIGTFDLTFDGFERNSSNHSPIIGWAYDGCPIYGPYGYDTPEGGTVRSMVSGYEESTSSRRPSSYPVGFFVEDFAFTKSGDLDEHNGRFCKTPDYPEGKYCYFATIDSGSPSVDGKFKNYKLPTFPYFIGNTYNAKPTFENDDKDANQVSFKRYDDLYRNTKATAVNNKNGTNDYLDSSIDDPKQISKIKVIKKGKVTGVDIVSAGSSFRIGDFVVFDQETPTLGKKSIAKVTKIEGKKVVSIASSSKTFENIELFSADGGHIVGYGTTAHNLENRRSVFVSDLNSNGYRNHLGITIRRLNTKFWSLNQTIGDVSATGLTTSIRISGDFNKLVLRENSILGFGTAGNIGEQIKVLNVDPLNSRVKIQREYNGTVGAAYSTGQLITEVETRFYLDNDSGVSTSTNPPTFQRYFNPSEVVGLGTTTSNGVAGIGTTVTYEQFNNITPPHLNNINYSQGIGRTSRVIPFSSILIPNHSFETGDKLEYSANGETPIEVSNLSFSFDLPVGIATTIYAIKISDDLLGISTESVGLGSTGLQVGTRLSFTGVGAGTTHSFKALTNPLTATLKTHEATFTTSEPHLLKFDDLIDIEVEPATINESFVQYNNYHRRIVFDRALITGVTSTTDSLTIPNHKIDRDGQKVIFTTTGTAPGGLVDNGIYYAIIMGDNTIKLASTFRDARNNVGICTPINITSSGSGENFVSKINPVVSAYKGSKVSFALTDTSLSNLVGGVRISAFDMNIYTDELFENKFLTTKNNSTFNVQKVGTVGVTTDAALTIRIDSNVPKTLYYKFENANIGLISKEQSELIIDEEQNKYNQIVVGGSLFNFSAYPLGIGTTTFTYDIARKTEATEYTTDNSILKYSSRKTDAMGSIAGIDIVQRGSGYTSIPGITSVITEKGTGANLTPIGDMGKIQTVLIEDNGYNYPSDPTLKVFANAPQVLILDECYSIGEIGITSGGKNYTTPPTWLVKDSTTNLVKDGVKIYSEVENGRITKIEVLENTNTLSNSQPILIPTQNSNGIGIQTITYDSSSRIVSVGFDTGFSDSFPFAVGDEVYVENVGLATAGSGYNSSDYDYQKFKLIEINANVGGIGSVKYQLPSTVTDPGGYSVDKGYGKMIPASYLPTFDISLFSVDFYDGEDVSNGETKGVVSKWNNNSKTLKVTGGDFQEGDVVNGVSSGKFGIVIKKYDDESYFYIAADPIRSSGWTKETGKTSINTQRIHDSDYYQYFSYALKSKIPYSSWDEPVSSLNHTSGFKKFSNMVVESEIEENVRTKPNVDSDVTTNVELSSVTPLYCYNDFDYATEKTKTVSDSTFSYQVIFENKELIDHTKSIGNRVLSIDDFSGEFNSQPRSERFSVVDTFKLDEVRARKYVLEAHDSQFTADVSMGIVELIINDSGTAHIQEYGILSNGFDSYYDFSISGDEGQLIFYPEKFSFNNYDIQGQVFSFSKDTFSAVGISTLVGAATTLSDIAQIENRGGQISSGVGTAVNIFSFDTAEYNAFKLLVVADQDGIQEMSNVNIIQDGSDVYLLDYARITNDNSSTTLSYPGIGTFGAELDSSIVYLNYTPATAVGAAVTFNILATGLKSGVSTVGISTTQIKNGRIIAGFTSIPASGSPGITTIIQFVDPNDGGYSFVEVTDVTNGYKYGVEINGIGNTATQIAVDYAIIDTTPSQSGLGTFGIQTDSDGVISISFVPNPSIITNVRSITHTAEFENITQPFEIEVGEDAIQSVNGFYRGTEADVRRSFGLYHDGLQIFTRNFNAEDTSIVSLSSNFVTIPNHFFVTGERLTYSSLGTGTTSNIGIATTTVSGISTDKLPFDLYAVKIDDQRLGFAGSAEDALILKTFNFTSVGIGTSHVLQANDQNSKVLIALDNNIQDPVVSVGITEALTTDLVFGVSGVNLTGVTSIFGADLLRIDDEIVKVSSVGIGSTNRIVVERGWMGTPIVFHATGSVVTKLEGAYNIVGNTLNFYTAPRGPIPVVDTNDPNALDWTGIQTHTTFSGRSFMRNSALGLSTHTYSTNYVFDNINRGFNGINKTFSLTVDNQEVAGFSTDNALVLVNQIAQIPSMGSDTNNFTLTESSGQTDIVFTGVAASATSDVNSSGVPVGGVIISVGSSEGFGYQPLVAAGATAIISGIGTIESLGLGNTGSGYRVGVETSGVVYDVVYNVGIKSDTETISIGTAVVSGGHVTQLVLDAPYTAGSAFTSTNPPKVVIDSPISYSNIPLHYDSASTGAGLGTEARVDIQVGQGSSVINFTIRNTGYGYLEKEILTVPTTGLAGIPTDITAGNNFVPFNINIESVAFDEFSAWHFGALEVLDSFADEFDGTTKTFQMTREGEPYSINTNKGSLIDLEQTLIVFINDILQVPGAGYIFNGGSQIRFTEAPKEGDTVSIMFYKGTEGVDVEFFDILETIKVGDTVRLEDGDYAPFYRQDPRTVTEIESVNTVDTNPYIGVGVVTDTTFSRPVTWCKQQEDIFINGTEVTKDRLLYEPNIFPSSYLINNVGIGSTFIYVDKLRPLFTATNEAEEDNDKITFISQENTYSGEISATVSGFGTVTLSIDNSGYGHTVAPTVTVASPLGVTSTATATATIGAGGTISVVTVTGPGAGYTNTNVPQVLVSPTGPTTLDIEAGVIEGDSGIIVGIGSTGNNMVNFDLFIPMNSAFRNAALVGTAITISGISTGDYFVVTDTSVGVAETSINSLDSADNIVGTGISFFDNVYIVDSLSIVGVATTAIGLSTDVSVGTAVTYVTRVNVKVEELNGDSTVGIGTSFFAGNYSWGKITMGEITKEFSAQTLEGIAGLTTSTLVNRTTKLKSKGYVV
jgi:hypothetical protein